MRPAFGAEPLLVIVCLLAGLAGQALPAERGAMPPAEAGNPLKELIPGENFLPASIRALQDDDFDNPAFVFVDRGEKLWSTADGAAGKSCQSCHGGNRTKNTIERVAASYPKYSREEGRVITLKERINLCRVKGMKALAWSDGQPELLAVIAYMRSLARGSASEADIEGPAKETFERGRKLYETKLGLFQLSCAQCHNDNYGHNFGAEMLSQGQPQGYPAFKVSEKRMISLHQRFRMCNKLAREEPQPENSPDYIALELYLAWRSKNLPITAPGVRP